MVNKVFIEGRLVADPEVKQLNNEKKTKVANFSLAINKANSERPDFHLCVAYNGTADIAEKLQKGKNILVEGRLNQKVWEDSAQKKHRVTEIIVDLIHFTGSKKAEELPE